MPEFFAGARIHGVDDAPGTDAVKDAVVDQRRRLLSALRRPGCGRDIHGPGKSQAAHIGSIDLLQRTVSLLRPAPVVADPFVAGFAGISYCGFIDPPWLLCNRSPDDDQDKDQ